MSEFFAGWQAIVENALLYSGLALSQYVLLRVGLFSISTVGYAAIGAYSAAIATVQYGVPAPIGVVIGGVVGALAALLQFVPVAHLRGVFQAIASFAFVQIVQSLLYFWESVTGGSSGLNGIPKSVGLGWSLVAVVVMVGVLTLVGRSRVGRAFDAIRQDETVAVCVGIRVASMHRVAFGLSGAIAGVTGALIAYHDYSLMPETFGFGLLVNVLAYVVLGGYSSAFAPIIGTFILVAVPELFRVFADYRMIMTGLLLIVVMVYLPRGIVDSVRMSWSRRRRGVAHG